MAQENKIPVDPKIRAEFGEMVDLILATESMNDVEKEYWVQLLPALNKEQMSELKDILTEEQKALKNIAEGFVDKAIQAGTKMMPKDHEMRKVKMEQLRKKEASDEKQEAEEEAKLLSDLE